MGVSFSLARPKQKKSSVRIKVVVHGASFSIYTGHSIPTEFWDYKKSFIKTQIGQSSAAKAAKYLRGLQLQMNDILDDYRFGFSKMSFMELQMKMHQLVNNPKSKWIKENKALSSANITLIEFIDQFVIDCETGKKLSKKGKLIKPGTLDSFKTAKATIQSFESYYHTVVQLNEVDEAVLNKISAYVIEVKGHALNTHSKLMSSLKQIFEYAKKTKVISKTQFDELDFDTRREETDSIYLNEDEILEMYRLTNLPSKEHEIVRDVFVAACFLGLRYSDYSKLSSFKIVNNRLEVIQVKTEAKVILPIHPIVNKILTKYKHETIDVPKNSDFNRIIKEVGALMPSMQVEFTKQITYNRETALLTKPKWCFLQSHCCRRSLATNEFLRGTDIPTIMAITGHKTIKNFLRYVKADGAAAAEKLEKSWDERYKEIR